MTEVRTHSAAESQALGTRLAKQLCRGDVLLLEGTLGAGKSEFARGIARGLGITGYVTSPSFTILQVHEGGRLPLYHFDWYRLQSADELYELSMEEYLYGEGVAVVEWPSMAEEAVPACRLRVKIAVLSDTERRFHFLPEGGFRTLDWAALEEKA